MNDFPRGWLLSDRETGGGPATTTSPAAPNVAHVIDHVSAKYINEGAANPPVVIVNLTSTSLGTIYLGDLFLGGTGTSDSLDEDVQIAGAPGEAVTVAFSGPAANCVQQLIVTGHDI